ncbi:hypothetical protein [Streptosporangium carneum]|uniref:Uncharacterized protein n=1 Tax=Streptosporangium carneum TaxID=47481 RepID=A0A9W6HWL4_9ACTN|nr:hypothetical protein [Streptosporangium carneum]GLK07372.1 hypothetical protein GCM10017600_07770 [Streptosporangium carneum]
MPTANNTLIFFGLLGGLLPDLLRFIKGRNQGFPDYWRKSSFWLGLILLMLLGGFAAWIGRADEVTEALAYGYGAPEILSRILGKDPETEATRGGKFRLRAWWDS